ncbi:hypothetical protein PF005_g965 [Phytophthora fragariae]|uniref:Secreted protein n=1 Tax=Phytophthora fragariae TaxID=53985 RepID=A0A6A3URJ5_9STRA|nr:hypothetical protein PF003_g27089 [Phytophthora fragariae]KAE8941129.1 hypothetical protein PF009_g9077 [Phytophthora fragariae]KAE9029142.1 hypothetical protein PF011_g1209 [Phytophthora fragariae]KAE9119548.1 hypothetical protein PF007_g8503 [Phytophthora fragariae]KAE9137165.1 hypothetical protein PF010_g1430 [Phytophthora fragariae]
MARCGVCASFAIPLVVLAEATLWAHTSVSHVNLALSPVVSRCPRARPAPAQQAFVCACPDPICGLCSM